MYNNVNNVSYYLVLTLRCVELVSWIPMDIFKIACFTHNLPFLIPARNLLYICSEKVALQALKASDWHLEGAFDVFYSNQPQIKAVPDSRQLEKLYNRYKGYK